MWLWVASWIAVPAAAQQTHILVVAGLGGDPGYTTKFHEWATTLLDAAANRYEVPLDNLTYLGETPSLAPETIADRSSRENVEAAIDAIATRAEPGDHVVIVLFGHGSFTDAARINLPGRDLSADDFAVFLDRLAVEHVTFVNTASASGPFVEKLSGKGRVVMTATRTGGERNASVFGGYFVEAFADGEADADQNKDNRVSMLEAFVFARLRVEQSYDADGRLATEHALLDDNGDGERCSSRVVHPHGQGWRFRMIPTLEGYTKNNRHLRGELMSLGDSETGLTQSNMNRNLRGCWLNLL